MIVLDCAQGSDTWLEAKRAKPSSTGFSNIVTTTGKVSASWDRYRRELLAAYIDDEYESFKATPAMTRGIELEPEARNLYQDITGHKVDEVGGLWLNDDKDIICSPDGLIHEKKKGLEIKCPGITTHLEYLETNKVPTKYMIQIQSGLLFSGFETWDFMSYHPKYKPLILTVKRNETMINNIKKYAIQFNNELKKHKLEIDEFNKVEF